jgi:hypothetical protein
MDSYGFLWIPMYGFSERYGLLNFNLPVKLISML